MRDTHFVRKSVGTNKASFREECSGLLALGASGSRLEGRGGRRQTISTSCIDERVPIKVRDGAVPSDAPMRGVCVVRRKSRAAVRTTSITTPVVIGDRALSWGEHGESCVGSSLKGVHQRALWRRGHVVMPGLTTRSHVYQVRVDEEVWSTKEMRVLERDESGM